MKSIGPEEFFIKVTTLSGVNDIQTVRDIYYGMVRTISRELKEKGIVKLPDWGDFYIVVQKEKVWPTREENGVKMPAIVIPPTAMVKFSPDYKVKKYFRDLGADSSNTGL